MSTNVFSASAMAAVAAAAMGTGSSRHHHSAAGSQSTMLFTPTPVAGTHLGLSSSPTAFPFPPPSPLFLPTALNLLQHSPQASHSHLQPLSPWIAPSHLASLSSLGISSHVKFCDATEFASDDNNNDLNTSSTQLPNTPPKSKFRSMDQDLSGNETLANRPFLLGSHADLKSSSNGLLEYEKEKSALDKGFSQFKSQANHCRSDHQSWVASEAADSYSPSPLKASMSKLPDSKPTDSSGLTFKPSFLGPQYVGTNSVASPTLPGAMRPPPPSPHTPTQHAAFGAHYPHYLLPPSLYSYYHNAQQAQSFSPSNQSQSSPISPFIVPNFSQSASPPMISPVVSNACHQTASNSNSSILEAFSHNALQSNKRAEHVGCETNSSSTENPSSQKSQLLRSNSTSHIIDLAPDRRSVDSPVDCTRHHSSATRPESKPSTESGSSLKRKSSIEEASNSLKPSTPVANLPDDSNPTSSRKHRILKPPNIDISECDFRNGLGPAFVHSPLLGHFASQLPSSPYTYLDPIPLSAPPIAPSRHGSKFDFPATPDPFTYPSSHRFSFSSSKDIPVSHSLLNPFSSNSQLTSISTSKNKSTNQPQVTKHEIPSSIMKDSRKKTSINCEAKVTFQEPNLSKSVIENQENRETSASCVIRELVAMINSTLTSQEQPTTTTIVSEMVRTNQRKSLPTNELLSPSSTNLEQQNISRKSKFRYLTARSDDFEKQIAQLLQSLSGYARCTAKLRDSGDVMAEALNAISFSEVLNPSLKKSTFELAKCIRSIDDHRDSEVLSLEDKLLPEISRFGESLQKQRDEVRSGTNKVFEGKDRGSSWIKSSSSTRRRSQSAERSERLGKEEKALQQSIQRYELDRNFLLKKFMLKFVLAELRFAVRSVNNLSQVYKQISAELNPTADLRTFCEFFNFRPLSKSAQSEVADNVRGVESSEEETADESDNEASNESGLDDDSDDVSDSKTSREDEFRRGVNSEEESENSKSDGLSIQSTLRRFNSTPEMVVDAEFKDNNKARILNNLLQSKERTLSSDASTKGGKNKSNLKKANELAKGKADSTTSTSNKLAKRNSTNVPDWDNSDSGDESDDKEDVHEGPELNPSQFKASKSKPDRAW